MHVHPAEPLRIVVLAGGDSAEREISLQSGRCVSAALKAVGHAVETVDPAETDLEALDLASRCDVCFLALHGGAGEDGRIQQWLQDRQIPYTGSGPAASRAAMNKAQAKQLFHRAGVPSPDWVLLTAADTAEQALRRLASLGFPLILKPNNQGSSVGLGMARSAAEVPQRLAESRQYDREVLVERYIAGREFTVAVLGRRALPLLEVVGHAEVFDYTAKYRSPVIEHRFQTDLPPMKVQEIQQTAVAAAEALGTSGLVRVDLRLDAAGCPWVLEVNTLPGMTEHSLAPEAAARAGLAMSQLCDWMVRDALARDSAS